VEAAVALEEGGALAGRYRLDRRTGGTAPEGADAPAGSTQAWRGHDLVLDRPVELLAVAGGADDVVDAARRAALVDDVRVLRVLDVGDDAGWAFVVTASMPGESLAALVHRRGPLPAPLVRTLVGEAAQALERARALGLHHRRLTPSSLRRAADGGVVVTGVEVHAAVAEGGTAEGHGGDVDPDVAARADAVALVALVYAGLTGRWPGPLGGGGAAAVPTRPDGLDDADEPALPLAPRAGEGPVAPGDLVEGVPADLDVLCVVTLGPHEDGPRTPGELVEELAPWGSPYGDGRAGGGTGARRDLGGRLAAGVPPARRPGGVPEDAQPPDRAGDGQDAAVEDEGRERSARRAGAPVPVAVPVGAGAVGAGAVGAGAVGAGAVASAAAAAPSGPAGAGALRRRPRPPRRFPAPAGPGGSAALSAGPPGGPGSGDHGGRGADGSGADGSGADGSGARGGAPRGAAVAAAEPAERPARAQTAVVLVLVLAAVAAALALAVGVLTGTGGGGDQVADPAPVATETAAPTPEEGAPAPAPEPAPEQAPAPQVVGAQSLDPLGDDEEGDSSVGAALDGDPGTAWTSSSYTTAALGNLKDGFGYALDLGRPSTVTAVALTTAGTGGTVEVRTAPGAALDGSEVVATAELTAGGTDVVLPQPVSTQHLVLWFTSLPDVGDGFRVEMSSVQVR